ncbi:nucleotidyltransferase family protein [Pseudomonas sp. GD03860]|uniref:nucleotidyltransferase family protein n=1 Tax=Pseudomonas TaxID=286 RepID=UPI002364476A|nr:MULTISPECIES: nucleotidyltransferase family protein [Pseudomonas]MDD2058749.1 nucleotidyltransferase family protein [Pseudomonas putida]MDH0636982.1 nucleotidyltransferase family protein [Pseudomonas sp. GD03860]
MTLTADALVSIAMTNPINAEILARLPALGVNQCLLTAGCLFQAVWNHQAQQDPGWGIKDYDVFYFDPDLSWEAEDEVIQRAGRLFHDLGANVEVRNQARVHLWYGERFGRPYPQLQSARDGVDRYLIAGTCIALDPTTGEVHAPFGLEDVAHGLLRINPNNPQPDLFAAKAGSYQSRWPWLQRV